MTAIEGIDLTAALPPAGEVDRDTQIKATSTLIAIARRHDVDPRLVLTMLFAPPGPRRCADCGAAMKPRIGKSNLTRCGHCATARRKTKTQ